MVQIAPPFNHSHKWNFPGGVIEQGEDIKEGLVREVFEESGVICKILSLQDQFTFPPSGDEIFIFNAIFIKGELRLQEEEILDARWVKISEPFDLPLAYSIEKYFT